MTMTREEQIIKIGAQFAIDETDGQTSGRAASMRDVLLSAFRAGAHWADSYPNWISVDEKLPPYNEKVLVFYGIDRYIGIASLVDVVASQMFWYDGRKSVYNITHWMPIVPPRKEE